MIKKALSEYRSSESSYASSSVNGNRKSARKEQQEHLRNGKGVRVRLSDTSETDPILEVEKVASSNDISLFCHVDATDWCPNGDIVNFLAKFFTKKVRIEIYPRSMVGTIWSKDHGCKPYTKDYYAFRAYAGKDYCKIFVDETETKESALWVLLHELAHISLACAPYLFKAFRHLTPDDYFESDDAHERDPEEQMANSMAMSWMDMLGYGKVCYPRHWWRKRTMMNKTASLIGGLGGAAYMGATGFSSALTEKRQDELEFLKGNISREELDQRNKQRAFHVGLNTAAGGVGGAAIGQGIRKVVKDVGATTAKRVEELGEEGAKRMGELKTVAEDAIKRSAEEYEAMGKRISTHNAEEMAKKLDETRKKLPWYLRGEKTAGYSALKRIEEARNRWQR